MKRRREARLEKMKGKRCANGKQVKKGKRIPLEDITAGKDSDEICGEEDVSVEIVGVRELT